MANGDDIINTIIAITDMIGSLAKGVKKLKTIWKRKASKIRKSTLLTTI